MSRANTSCASHWENDKDGTTEQNLRLEAEGTGNDCRLVLLTWLQECLPHIQTLLACAEWCLMVPEVDV